MSENLEEVLDTQEEAQEQTTNEQEVVEEKPTGPISQDEEGVIKVNLSDLNKPEEPEAVEEVVEQEETENLDTTESESILEEVTEEQVEAVAEELEEQVEQAIVEQSVGIDLPDNIKKVVEFMNETGVA